MLKQKLSHYSKLTLEPGLEGRYTNVGYMVLAAVIEAVSGQSYETYVRTHILEPLCMNRTDFIYTKTMEADEATGAHPRYDFQTFLLPLLVKDVSTLIRERQHGVIWFNHIYSDQNGPTGLIGSPSDLARLLLAYLNGGELEGQRILSEASIQMMTSEAHVVAGKTPESSAYDKVFHGLGWFVVPLGDGFYLEHRGGGPGFATAMRLYPGSDLGIVIMANGTYLDSMGILDLVASLEW